jgi:Glycosyltransferase family 28 C-terminal domain
MSILFHAVTRRGLGHAMRAGILIQAIQAQQRSIDCLLGTTHDLPEGLLPVTTRWMRIGTREADLTAIRGYGADVVVFDTVVPDGWRDLIDAAANPRGVRIVLILRELRQDALARLRSHPILADLAAVLVPHQREEFDPELPGTTHVGPIARCAVSSAEAIGARTIDVLSTAGGGGHRELCEPFVAQVLAADRLLRSRGHDFRHVLVTGPRYEGTVPDAGAVEVCRFEPGLPQLIAAAGIVVSRAGYNTVAEIQAAGTRGILIPGDPGLDDQRGRAARLVESGRAVRVEPGDIEGLAIALARNLTTPSPRLPLQVPVAGREFTSGAELAASCLLALTGIAMDEPHA